MEQFRTIVPPLQGLHGTITHEKPIVMLGSCFTDNIGAKLQESLFNCSVNPMGTLYNPASIAVAIFDLLYERDYTTGELFNHNGLWHSWSHHSRFSSSSPEEAVAKMNHSAAEARSLLKDASALIVTFGTSYIFRLKEGRNVVANCHKMPASMFDREFLQPSMAVNLWKKILREIAARYPDLKVIFTVSPIRHLADGAHGNQLSKAALLTVIDRLVAEHPQQAIYFPSYEIMLDDLRDYRFYAPDMVHPSSVAIDYIYTRFCESFMTDGTIALCRENTKLFKRLSHRPLSSDAIDEKFIHDTNNLVNQILLSHPHLKPAINRLLLNKNAQC